MSIIVDAYNYIGHSQELHLDDPSARDKVIYLMGQYCARVKKSVTLVFDGNYFAHQTNRKRRYGRVTVLYTSPIYTADDAIKKMVKNQEARRRKSMLIVSSDREILDYATSHGAPVLRSEEFEGLLYQTLETPKKLDRVNIQLSEKEVQEWLREFGTEPADEKKTSKHEKPHKPPSSSAKKLKTGKPTSQGTQKRSRRSSASSGGNDDIDRVHVHLSPQAVEEWMSIFGEEEED